MAETTATAVTNLPAQAPWVKIASKAGTNSAVLPTSAWCGTRPITAADTSRYKMAQGPVPSTEARPTFRRGSGVILIAAGVLVLGPSDRPSAEISRWIGIIAAGLDAIAAIFVIPYYPVWSLIYIAIAVMVI